MRVGTYEIEYTTETAVGFDHEHNEWDPAYLYLSADALMATGKGKRFATGITTRARASAIDPAIICTVMDRYRQLTGEDLPVSCSSTMGALGPDLVLHEYEIVLHDRPDGRRAIALKQAFEERWPAP